MTFAELIRYHRRAQCAWVEMMVGKGVHKDKYQTRANFHKRAADFLEAQAQAKEPPHA